MRNKKWALLALALVLGLFAAACQQQPAGEEGDGEKPEYRIGFMGDLSGANALLVVGGRDGATLAIQQANEKGDLPIKLRIQPEDTVADKDKAVTLAQKLAADNRIIAVVGPAFSGESFSAGPILQGANIPQITPSATNPGLAQQGWKLWWRGVGNDNSQGGPAPDVITKILKGTKVFVGHDKTAYGEGLATIVRDNLNTSKPGSVVGFEAVDPGKEDYSAIASKLVSSGADVFFWGAYSP
ncbi:MAG: branched-chain amino acid ABC transporter substrate-binding protein, partial [Acidimicrobiia bacterium]